MKFSVPTALVVIGAICILGSIILFFSIQNGLEQSTYNNDYIELNHISNSLKQQNFLAIGLIVLGFVLVISGIRSKRK